MPHKILVIRSGAIGDVIMATPFLKNLRKYFNDSHISFLVGAWSSSVLDNNPDVDNVIVFDDNIIINKQISKIVPLVLSLRKEKFDICFILDKSWVWGLFAFLCGINKRVGFSRGNEGRWNTHSVVFNGTKSEIGYNLDLLRKIDIKAKNCPVQLYTTKNDRLFAGAMCSALPKGKKIIGMFPGGASNPGQNAAIKRWPLSNYISLLKRYPAFFIVFSDDVIKGNPYFLDNKKILNISDTTVQQSKEILEYCDVVLSHDSGGLHIAACAKKPKLIALFGPTPLERFCPKKAIQVRTASLPCYDIYGKFKDRENQMGEISVERVISILDKY